MSMASDSPAVPAFGPVRLSPGTPTRPDWFRRFILDYNPFFLLSALLMLFGSLLLTNSLSWSPVRLQRVLLLTATINVYELIVVGLGLFLVVRRGARRDAGILLIVEAFFLVDVSFLNAELFAIDRWVGLIANAVLLVLAMGKLAVIFRVLRVPLTSPIALCLAGEVIALYALPGALKFYATHRGGTLPPMAMFVAWWMLAVIGAAMVHALRRPHATPPLLAWFPPFTAILAGVSLVAHAATGQWVYDLSYWGANLAPMLALTAFVLCQRVATVPAGLVAAVAALFATSGYERAITFDALGSHFTPVHLTIAVVYVVLAWTLVRAAFGYLMAAGAGVACVYLFGPTAATLRYWADAVLDRVTAIADALRPRTQTQWGVISVAMSFVFLVIGAIVSLRRGHVDGEAIGPAQGST